MKYALKGPDKRQKWLIWLFFVFCGVLLGFFWASDQKIVIRSPVAFTPSICVQNFRTLQRVSNFVDMWWFYESLDVACFLPYSVFPAFILLRPPRTSHMHPDVLRGWSDI